MNVIVLCTDDKYVNHIKYNVNNIRDKHGNIDICVTYDKKYDDYIQKELKNFNIILKPYSPLTEVSGPYVSRFHIFEMFFKQWNKVLYIDCDTCVLNKLYSLFDLINDTNVMFADYEPYSIKEAFTNFTERKEWNVSCFNLLDTETHVNVNITCFNSGLLLFSSSIILEDTVQKLYDIHNKYVIINNHCQNGLPSDQPILNIIFGNICKKIHNNYFSYWESINDNTLIMHFCRWNAPWFNNYYSEQLGEKYKEYYDKMAMYISSR